MRASFASVFLALGPTFGLIFGALFGVLGAALDTCGNHFDTSWSSLASSIIQGSASLEIDPFKGTILGLLWEQFRRIGNIYFLVISALQARATAAQRAATWSG